MAFLGFHPNVSAKATSTKASSAKASYARGLTEWLYCLGERPIIRLNAVLNALSDSYPSEKAMVEIGSSEFISRSLASNIRHRVR